MGNKAVNYPHALEFVPQCNKTLKKKKKKCDKAAYTIRLSRHEQVCLSGLRFETYFSH